MRVYKIQPVDPRPCLHCGQPMPRKPKEVPFLYKAKKYCNRVCMRAAFKAPPLTIEDLLARSEPEPNSGCWLWSENVTDRGYAMVWDGKHKRAARLAWTLTNGDILPGLEVCHRCDCRLCINPDHLFLGTHQDNMDDMVRKGRNARLRGDDHGCSLLTADQVIAIRQDPRIGRIVAKDYGVSKSTIHAIRCGQNWGWMK